MIKATSTDTVRLLEADPDLGGLLTGTRRQEAERELVVRVHRLGVGVWDVSRLEGAGADHVGLLLLDGVIAREVIVADHVSAELLGPGDLVRPWQDATKADLLPVDVLWSILSPSSFAVLDRRFAGELARWPEVTAALFERLSERSLRLGTTQAISQLTRVDRRLKALLWHLAERWGRVSGDGVVVPLALTHRILGQLVGARRPTVSTALGELAERGELVRRVDGSWVLRGSPPDASALGRRRAMAGRPHDLMRPVRQLPDEPPPTTASSPRSPPRAATARRHRRHTRDPCRVGHAADQRTQGGRHGDDDPPTPGSCPRTRRAEREEIIELLKKAYWMEIETVMSYIANSVNPDGVRAQEIIESLQEDVQEELGHAQQFAARIKELYGVVPGSLDFTAEQSYLQPPEHQTDIVHVVKGVIEAETGAIEHYNHIIEVTDGVDFVTQDMVIAILRDEEGHRRLFEGYLREYEAEGLA